MPMMKPTAHAPYPAKLIPDRGPAHFLPDSSQSATMAPMIGPNDAPMMVNSPTRLAATPVIARIAATTAPTMVEVMRDTPGIMVARLLPAINEEKHIDTMDAMANNKKAIEAKPPVCAMAESK